MNLESFDAFVARLGAHDWYYEFSDDNSVWRAGRDESKALAALAKTDPMLQVAYDAWRTYATQESQLDYTERKLVRNATVNAIRALLQAQQQNQPVQVTA